MKEIVVISGKGGTGKTSITSSLAILAGKDVILADCDVDAADMHILMRPDFAEKHEFYSGKTAEIIQDECTKCGKCMQVCRFDAISIIDGKYIVDPISCEGCEYCARICPVQTIEMKENLSGHWYRSNIRTGTKMIHAKLGIGSDNSGKLVAQVKKEAKKTAETENKNMVLVDGPPGVACPVVSSLSGADYVLLVTEPTVSGVHDLKRVYELAKKFRIKAGCVINKADLNESKTKQITDFLEKENIELLSVIPYDESFSRAMVEGKAVVEIEGSVKKQIEIIWEKIQEV